MDVAMFKFSVLVVFAFLLPFCNSVYVLECYACNSAANPDCATGPGQQIDVEDCPAGDECVTTIINGVTHRGCLSKVIPSKYCDKMCQKCLAPLCNKEIFPADRLKCYQCIGGSCVDVAVLPPAHRPKPCPMYSETDKCITNIVYEGNVIRDCESSRKDEACKNICLKCNYDGCNAEPGVTTHTCVQCSSYRDGLAACKRVQTLSEDGLCRVGNVSTCTSKILHGHKGKCFTYHNEQTNVVDRGCSTNMGFYPTGKLWQCFGENCNDDCLDIQCVVCDSTSDPRCRDNPKVLATTTCEPGTVSCYSCEQGSVVTRGCGVGPRTGACSNCFKEDGCNKENVRTCYSCTSTEDQNCDGLENEPAMTREICSDPKEMCVTTRGQKLEKKYTIRGCESTVTECTRADPYCERCEGSLCNGGTAKFQLRNMFPNVY